MSKVKLPKVVEVYWRDASFDSGYYTPSKHVGIIQRSAGILIEENKKGLKLGMTQVDESGKDFRQYLEIPQPYILKIRKFK